MTSTKLDDVENGSKSRSKGDTTQENMRQIQNRDQTEFAQALGKLKGKVDPWNSGVEMQGFRAAKGGAIIVRLRKGIYLLRISLIGQAKRRYAE